MDVFYTERSRLLITVLAKSELKTKIDKNF